MNTMADEQGQKEKLVRFDFPSGAKADEIAAAIEAMRERVRAERAAKQQKTSSQN
jgi:hypothetical protein